MILRAHRDIDGCQRILEPQFKNFEIRLGSTSNGVPEHGLTGDEAIFAFNVFGPSKVVALENAWRDVALAGDT